jgi:hypothetical protein
MYFGDLIATDGHHVPHDTSDPTAPYVSAAGDGATSEAARGVKRLRFFSVPLCLCGKPCLPVNCPRPGVG